MTAHQELLDIAAGCLDTSSGDVRVATAMFVSKIEGDDRLLKLLTKPLVRSACYDVVRSILKGRRQIIWNSSPDASSTTTYQRKAALISSNIQSLLDFPLGIGNGLLLRDAVKSEVLAAAEFYMKQGKDMMAKGGWLAKIATLLPDDKTTVVDVLSDVQLRALKDGREVILSRNRRPRKPAKEEHHLDRI